MTVPGVQQTLPHCYLLPVVGTECLVTGYPDRIIMITNGKSHRTDYCIVRRCCADANHLKVKRDRVQRSCG